MYPERAKEAAATAKARMRACGGGEGGMEISACRPRLR